MSWKTFLGALVRHSLTIAGGALVHKGIISGDQLPDVVGGVMAVGGVAWSLVNKHQLTVSRAFGG